MSLLTLPSLADPHVHLREPGSENKEDFFTGTCAALAGGYTALLDMPNNPQPTISQLALEEKRNLAATKIVCDVGFNFGALPDNLAEYAAIAPKVAGLKAYLGETHGPLVFGGLTEIMEVFAAWPPAPEYAGKPILIHAEGQMVAAVIGLAALYDRKIHICHLSKKSELNLVRAAKARGFKVTCEVAPHHLFLTYEDAAPGSLGPYGKMSPALQNSTDVDALWQGLVEGSIDMVATDHAPHTCAEKESDKPPFGVPGLETAFGLLYRAACQQRSGLTVARLLEVMAYAPRRVFGLPPNAGEFEIDPKEEYTFTNTGLFTKCAWTPFAGMKGRGRIRQVRLRGAVVFEDGQVLAAPGSGKILF
ncbi:MAG: amidohydrolase family protein [Chloroflexi bacterium]|nr:amidohydrolase family protein [Chloroflexota bacterium]